MRQARFAVIIGLVALTGCHPRRVGGPGGIGFAKHPLTVGKRLTCPEPIEALTRTGQAADGQTCTYSGAEQEDVQLSLTPLGGGSVDTRLAALDQAAKAETPAAVSHPGGGEGIYVGEGDRGKQAHIDLPGFHLNATDGKASIRMPGVSIDANDDDANVTTSVGHAQSTVQAHEGGAEIRTGGVNANGVDVTYLLAAHAPGPHGYRVAGYMAKGPAAGPLVVGTFRVRGQDHDNVVGRGGLARLIDLNVGG